MKVKRRVKRSSTDRGTRRLDVLVDCAERKIVLDWVDAEDRVKCRVLVTYLSEGLAWLMTGPVELADTEIRITGSDPEAVAEAGNDYFRLAGATRWGTMRVRRPTSYSATGRPSIGSAIVETVPWGENPGAALVTEIYEMAYHTRIALDGEVGMDRNFVNSADRKLAARAAQHIRKVELRSVRKKRDEFERIAREARDALRATGREIIDHAGVMERKTGWRSNARPASGASVDSPQANGAARNGDNRAAPAPEPARPTKTEPAPAAALHVDLPADSVPGQLAERGAIEDFVQVETAALWWVSNQSDDLLCLPFCEIEKLEYQIRTALRVIGSLRGRALLSDEVGLGKTIEACLVLKELLTRGMASRFLILTVPSLVDQWEEELEGKFNLPVATTNHPAFKSDPERFWREEPAVVASLHTFKGDKHRSAAAAQPWDMLIVDEAHYLRNAASQAWKAVNSTPRKFLLLLTATPVQNSLDELYHLVTLLRPGQLPPPQEFQRRFIDKKRPHQPKEPEELRRLLGQVMIRNTRANAGIDLPPRRAETVLFEPGAKEAAFWTDWESELRLTLEALPANQARLWGRLLLQAAGSSPMAWTSALAKFPDVGAAARWKSAAPLRESWEKKTALLVPLAKTARHLVVFSQFLATQAALEERLREAGLAVFSINGQTPAADRHPITEKFRTGGGVLLLTHSGTEGRNLQFCHRLVNFDLPWNPMEIEQRIGRLHRIGQEEAVEIYNLVQAETLQAHLLDILQDKLNLFELVVGESGLILGDRFSSDDFEQEVFRRWREAGGGDLAVAFDALGRELQDARLHYDEVKKLDDTLFSDEYEAG